MMNVVFKEVLVCKCIKCSIPKDQLRYWYPLIDSGYFITLFYSYLKVTKKGFTMLQKMVILPNQIKSLDIILELDQYKSISKSKVTLLI